MELPSPFLPVHSEPSLTQRTGLCPSQDPGFVFTFFNAKEWANPVGQHGAFVLMSPSPGLWVSQLRWDDVETLLSPQNLEYCIMVVGVPNVGKSSLINSLRRQHLRSGRQSLVADFHSWKAVWESMASALLLGGIPSVARAPFAERTVNGLKEVCVANSHLLHSVFLPSFHALLAFMHFGLWDKFISTSFFHTNSTVFIQECLQI